MSRRKTICLVTASPDTSHSQRISQGVFAQCEKYGYNVAQFSSMINLDYFEGFKDHMIGEINIFELIDFSRFDGVVIDSISLMPNNESQYMEMLYPRIKAQPGLPAYCISMPYKDLAVVENANDEQIREICRHVIEVHGCNDICLLTGFKGNPEAEQRLELMLDEVKLHGLEVSDEHIRYGDFWYGSGIQLAQDIIEGRIAKPDAVIAASDHMALGFIDEYTRLGGEIPKDICVIGFEGTPEAALNRISLTSIESNFAKCAADAVDRIRMDIEPDKEIIPYESDLKKMLHLSRSCGCPPDVDRTIESINHQIYYIARNYDQVSYADNVDIGLLMESHIPERLSASQSPADCIRNIHDLTFIIDPLVNFYLCLREDWLESDNEMTKGYPDRMKLMLIRSNVGEEDFCGEGEGYSFDTSLMLPQMYEDHDEPYVYYFSAVHFSVKTLGYAVLQRKLCDHSKFNLVYRNWLRFVNTALEMVRTKNRFVVLSVYDKMTGLLNRRGMYEQLEKLRDRMPAGKRCFACVIDMDGLKYINDTFGHAEGDYGIKRVGEAALAITEPSDICARAGGDEFYIVGVRDSFDSEEFTARFCDKLKELTSSDEKPFPVTASIGFAESSSDKLDIEELLSEADENMYRYKLQRKRQRK